MEVHRLPQRFDKLDLQVPVTQNRFLIFMSICHTNFWEPLISFRIPTAIFAVSFPAGASLNLAYPSCLSGAVVGSPCFPLTRSQLSLAEHVLLMGTGGLCYSALFSPLFLALSRRARCTMRRVAARRSGRAVGSDLGGVSIKVNKGDLR